MALIQWLFLQLNYLGMHELSIAIEIISIAEEEAKRKKTVSIVKVELEIGKLSGVEPDALMFAMEEAVKSTQLETTQIVYHFVEPLAVCEECCNEFSTYDHFKVCPVCNSVQTNFIKGKELKIRSIELETE